MTKDFKDIEVGDTIFFTQPEINKDIPSLLEITVKEIKKEEAYGLGVCCGFPPIVNIIIIGTKGEKLVFESERIDFFKSEEVPPRRPIVEADLTVGGKTEYGYATTSSKTALVVNVVFTRGSREAQANIRKSWEKLLGSMGVQEGYVPPQVLK